jgi:hypothetical protein
VGEQACVRRGRMKISPKPTYQPAHPLRLNGGFAANEYCE